MYALWPRILITCTMKPKCRDYQKTKTWRTTKFMRFMEISSNFDALSAQIKRKCCAMSHLSHTWTFWRWKLTYSVLGARLHWDLILCSLTNSIIKHLITRKVYLHFSKGQMLCLWLALLYRQEWPTISSWRHYNDKSR